MACPPVSMSESPLSILNNPFSKVPWTRLFNDQLHICVVQDVQAVIGRARQLALEEHVLHAYQEMESTSGSSAAASAWPQGLSMAIAR